MEVFYVPAVDTFDVTDIDGNIIEPSRCWHDHPDLACRGEDVDVFDTCHGTRSYQRDIVSKYCSKCPVRRDCIIDAARHSDIGVIRGGVMFLMGDKRTYCKVCKLPCARKYDTDDTCFYCRSV